MTPGEVTVVHGIRSPGEGCERTLRVFVPGGTRAEDATGVLVLLDGQNVFARSPAGAFGTWAVDDAVEDLVGRGAIDPWIVIGVDHRGVDRIADSSPWPDTRLAFEPRGAQLGAFLAHDLRGWIDAHLPVRARRRRALGGSSLGGLVALFVAWRHPDAYPVIAAHSPSVMWSNGELFRAWSARHPAPRRIHLDAGRDERFDAGAFQLDYGAAVRDFAEHLRHLGHGPDELHVVIDPDGRHDEASWARRFPDALTWLVGRQAPAID